MKQCTVCQRQVNYLTRQRCAACYKYWQRNGRDRSNPPRVRHQRVDLCQNCHLSPTGKRHAQVCDACGDYRLRRGHDRPAYLWLNRCTICGRPRREDRRDKFSKGRCQTCAVYYYTIGEERPAALIQRRYPFGWCDCGEPATSYKPVAANGKRHRVPVCHHCQQEAQPVFIVSRIDYSATIGLLVHGICAHANHAKSPKEATKLYDIALKINEIEKELNRHGLTDLLSQPFPIAAPVEEDDDADTDGDTDIDDLPMDVEICTTPPTLPPPPAAAPGQRDQIRTFVSQHPGHTVSEIAALMGLPRPSVERHIHTLYDAGIVEKRTPPNRKRPQCLYVREAVYA